MKRTPSRLPECVVIEPRVFADDRGCFFETWNHTKFSEAGLDFPVAQANVSVSQQGVLRGLHYQWPNPQGKLVSVLEGEVYDVAVDIRRGSPRFGQWAAVILSAENRRQFWIPEGFAHGFVTLSERAIFTYLCTREYDAAADANLRWDDASLAIDWPIRSPSLSPKDAIAPFLADVPAQRLPRFVE
jgi:dTDP-4-dehydrorhamnose 3,5-epimerase